MVDQNDKITISEKSLDNLIRDVNELKKEVKNSLKIFNNKRSAYDKTVSLLKKYPLLKSAISNMDIRIKELEIEAEKMEKTTVKSSSVILREQDKTYIHRDEALESYINELKALNLVNKNDLNYIDNILDKISEDKYYKVIKLLYFEGKTQEETAEIIDCDTKTVKRNKNRLINSISVMLFPNVIFDELK